MSWIIMIILVIVAIEVIKAVKVQQYKKLEKAVLKDLGIFRVGIVFPILISI